MFARGAFDISDDYLSKTFACSSCLSHAPFISGYYELTNLSYQVALFRSIGADVRHDMLDTGLRGTALSTVTGLHDGLSKGCKW